MENFTKEMLELSKDILANDYESAGTRGEKFTELESSQEETIRHIFADFLSDVNVFAEQDIDSFIDKFNLSKSESLKIMIEFSRGATLGFTPEEFRATKAYTAFQEKTLDFFNEVEKDDFKRTFSVAAIYTRDQGLIDEVISLTE